MLGDVSQLTVHSWHASLTLNPVWCTPSTPELEFKLEGQEFRVMFSYIESSG